MEDRENNTIYNVVVNHEEQHSIWPAERKILRVGRMPARAVPKQTVWPISRKFGPT